MKILDFANPERGDARLVRTAAVTFIVATAIVALYFGQEVLIPVAIAMLFAFILGPAVAAVRRLLPLPLAVALVVLGALVVAGLLTVLVMTQLAEVAGSLTGYQANLQQKIQDIRGLSEGGGALSRFASMVASLAHDLEVTAGPAAAPAVQVQSGESSFASVAAFVAPLLHPLLTIGIAVILVVFILLDRDHLSDQFVRLFGASDVHATSEAIGDAAARVGRVLSLQLMTNFGFAVVVFGGLFVLGMPNALLWGLLAGGLRFIPYVGAALAAVLPTLIAFAIAPGWLQPFLVLGWIVGSDIVIGQIVEPLLFGESTGVTPLALILSAIFWGTRGGPSACCCRRRSPSACWCWARTCRISASCRSCWAMRRRWRPTSRSTAASSARRWPMPRRWRWPRSRRRGASRGWTTAWAAWSCWRKPTAPRTG